MRGKESPQLFLSDEPTLVRLLLRGGSKRYSKAHSMHVLKHSERVGGNRQHEKAPLQRSEAVHIDAAPLLEIT